MSLFDQQDLAELSHPDYPASASSPTAIPYLAAERARMREDLLQATEKLHALDTGTGQDRVGRCGELPGPVADQEPEVCGPVTEVHRGTGRRRRSEGAVPR